MKNKCYSNTLFCSAEPSEKLKIERTIAFFRESANPLLVHGIKNCPSEKPHPMGIRDCDFQVIRRRAGLKSYKKWCHTLRKNREDDWNEKFPSHVVAEWMGYSPEVAHKHYLRIYDRNVEDATATPIDDKFAQKLA